MLRRGVLLVLIWVLGFSLLWYMTGHNHFNDSLSCDSLTLSLPSKTELGSFAASYFDPEYNYRPEHVFSFESLRVSNRSLGFLRTALHKTVHVKNLNYIIYSYMDESRDLGGNLIQNPDTCKSLLQENAFVLSDQLRRFTASSSGGWHISIPDVSKATQIDISEFLVQWYREMEGELSIQSKRAVFVAEKPNEIVLLGHVVLRTQNQMYEANKVVWDIEKQYFQVKDRADRKQSEQELWLDYNLNRLEQKSFAEQPKGDSLCLVNTSSGQ